MTTLVFNEEKMVQYTCWQCHCSVLLWRLCRMDLSVFPFDYFLMFHTISPPQYSYFISPQIAAISLSASLMLMVLQDSCVNNSPLLLCCPVILSLFHYCARLSLLLAADSRWTMRPLSPPHWDSRRTEAVLVGLMLLIRNNNTTFQ